MITQVKDTVRHVRQHHAIEHATLHILAARFPGQRMAGISDPRGFTLFADLAEESVRRAVADAMLRLQSGDQALAIHPHCGTNLVVTGVLATVAALAGSGGQRRDPFMRFVGALLLVLPALLVAQPLGLRVQRYTTAANVSDRWLQSIYPVTILGFPIYRVEFA